VDDVGRLRVGPQSAGAMPGPACYDKGGTHATVTDADLLLGYLDPNYFLGGRQTLSVERARRAMRRRVAEPLGVSLEEAAFRVRKLVDGFMGQEIFKETALKGHDPREFLLLAFGGAGPVHCCGYAEYADITRIVTFPFGAVFNAFGAGTMDVVQTYEASRRVLLFDPDRQAYLADGREFNDQVEALQVMALRDMVEEGFDLDQVRFELELDMTYARQIHSTRIVSPRLRIAGEADALAICEEFNRSYTQIHGPGSIYPEGGIEVMGFKLNAIGVMPRPDPQRAAPEGPDPSGALKGWRPVFWDPARGFEETPVYDGPGLRCGNTLEGPALVEAPDTVCAVPASWRYTVDTFLHGILEKTG
jgi:N-methylhydantoinase A/acetophenone carboxylase